uniref:Uncharacterized protein n=1 Tax=viral metagenome TaxID=1070528 RepID=A0A6C0JSS4_9ZZZZ
MVISEEEYYKRLKEYLKELDVEKPTTFFGSLGFHAIYEPKFRAKLREEKITVRWNKPSNKPSTFSDFSKRLSNIKNNNI